MHLETLEGEGVMLTGCWRIFGACTAWCERLQTRERFGIGAKQVGPDCNLFSTSSTLYVITLLLFVISEYEQKVRDRNPPIPVLYARASLGNWYQCLFFPSTRAGLRATGSSHSSGLPFS
jgi:hypothetical protein